MKVFIRYTVVSSPETKERPQRGSAKSAELQSKMRHEDSGSAVWIARGLHLVSPPFEMDAEHRARITFER